MCSATGVLGRLREHEESRVFYALNPGGTGAGKAESAWQGTSLNSAELAAGRGEPLAEKTREYASCRVETVEREEASR